MITTDLRQHPLFSQLHKHMPNGLVNVKVSQSQCSTKPCHFLTSTMQRQNKSLSTIERKQSSRSQILPHHLPHCDHACVIVCVMLQVYTTILQRKVLETEHPGKSMSINTFSQYRKSITFMF